MIKIVIYTTKITRRILYSKLNNEIVLRDVETKIWKRTRRRLRQLLRDSLPTWKSAISSRDIKGRRRRNSYRFDVIYRMLFFIKKKRKKKEKEKKDEARREAERNCRLYERICLESIRVIPYGVLDFCICFKMLPKAYRSRRILRMLDINIPVGRGIKMQISRTG